jgi:GR25 family glycosyltransferase involved in LPS biosynthesis
MYLLLLGVIMLIILILSYRYIYKTRTFSKQIINLEKSIESINIDNIYILNLRHRKDRWDRMLNRIKKWPEIIFKIERFNGYTGEMVLKNNPKINTNNFSKNSELGCAYSHYKIWVDAYNKNYQYVLILEDDIVFHKKWWEILQDVKIKDFDALFLNFSDPLPVKNRWSIISKQHMTGGYLLSRSGIEKLLTNFNEENLYVADGMTWWLQETKKCFGYYPWLCIQEGLDSDIQSNDHLRKDAEKVNKYIRKRDYDF